MNVKSSTIATIVALRTVTPRSFLVCAFCALAIVASAWWLTANQPVSAAISDDSSASSSRADLPIPLAIFDTFSLSPTTVPPEGFDRSFVGVFNAVIGSEVVTGTSQMDVCLPAVPGGVITCRFTYVRSDGEGSLVISSVCMISASHGAWNVERGTGRYRNFKAVGTQSFGALPPGGAFTQFERLIGIGTFDRHGNDHDDDADDDDDDDHE